MPGKVWSRRMPKGLAVPLEKICDDMWQGQSFHLLSIYFIDEQLFCCASATDPPFQKERINSRKRETNNKAPAIFKVPSSNHFWLLSSLQPLQDHPTKSNLTVCRRVTSSLYMAEPASQLLINWLSITTKHRGEDSFAWMTRPRTRLKLLVMATSPKIMLYL